MENELMTWLLSDPTIAAEIGLDRRIFPLKVPGQETRSAISFQRISTDPGFHLKGPDGLVQARLQVNCWGGEDTALPYGTARRLADAVKLKFDPQVTASKARPYPLTLGDYVIRNVRWLDEEDSFEGKVVDRDEMPDDIGVRLEFSVWYTEPATLPS
jgi:hypothetical protein